jgi:hypothetical protein
MFQGPLLSVGYGFSVKVLSSKSLTTLMTITGRAGKPQKITLTYVHKEQVFSNIKAVPTRTNPHTKCIYSVDAATARTASRVSVLAFIDAWMIVTAKKVKNWDSVAFSCPESQNCHITPIQACFKDLQYVFDTVRVQRLVKTRQ